MKMLLIGNGQMGTMIGQAARETGAEILEAFHTGNINSLKTFDQKADVLIDFSSPKALPAIADYVERTAVPLVSGTTGYDEEELRRLRGLSAYAPVLYSTNFSVGIVII